MNGIYDPEDNSSKKIGKRKTYGDENLLNRIQLNTLDLNPKNSDNFEKEFEEKTSEIDYVFNYHKKRKFSNIDSNQFISKIPKPLKQVKIMYSKYADFPTKIPKYSH
jgi:hypothetical protein